MSPAWATHGGLPVVPPGAVDDFVNGLLVGLGLAFLVWVLLHAGRSRTGARRRGTNLGCSKRIPHSCHCVLPHGHELRIHECEHGNVWAQDDIGQAGYRRN